MKKILGVLLGFCLIIPALMAADVSEINKHAWLSHIREMNVMRRQLIDASKKANNSAEDMAAYNELMAKFERKQAEWDEYITAVANDDEEGRAKVENRFQGERPRHGHHPGFRKHHHRRPFCECCKCTKCECENCKCCTCEKCECKKIAPKAEKKCMKADKCCGKCPKAEKCEKKCEKADKCCGECPKAEKKCMKADKCCGKCPKAEKKCMKADKCSKCPKAEKKCEKADKCGKCPKAEECCK